MIPFSPPRVDKKTTDAVTAVLLSGWITSGPKTKEFESKLADYSGNPTTLCLNSATAGLELVLRWFGVGPGDEVILPAYTYCATANVKLAAICFFNAVLEFDWANNPMPEAIIAIINKTRLLISILLYC